MKPSVFIIALLWLVSPVRADMPWENPPALPKPTGNVVNVTTEAELQKAVRELKSDTTILIAKGDYPLTNTLHVHGGLKNVAIRGATNNRDDVVLRGRGMKNKDHGNVPHGIMVSDAVNVQIANLSVGDVWFHPITLQGQSGCDKVHVYNVRLFEAGEQFFKCNPPPDGRHRDGCDESIVEYCVFEYADTARSWYTQGIDVHKGDKWIVRCNLFRNIRGPANDKMAGGAIDFWNGSYGTLVERNVILNCDVGIRLGIVKRQSMGDHHVGMIRNNFIYRAKDSNPHGDVGISLADSTSVRILHNTVLLEDQYPNAIEVRFEGSHSVALAGNLTNKAIRVRDGAPEIEAESGNVTNAKADWFVAAGKGDLRLSRRAMAKTAPSADCPEDFDGQKRPTKQVTIGADEP